MSDIEYDPNYWLECAKRSHQIAEQLEDESMKNIMEDIGKGYERMAEHVAHDLSPSGSGNGREQAKS